MARFVAFAIFVGAVVWILNSGQGASVGAGSGRLPSTKAGVAARQIDNQYEDCRRRSASFYGAEAATVCAQVMLDSPDFTPGAKRLWQEWKFSPTTLASAAAPAAAVDRPRPRPVG